VERLVNEMAKEVTPVPVRKAGCFEPQALCASRVSSPISCESVMSSVCAIRVIKSVKRVTSPFSMNESFPDDYRTVSMQFPLIHESE
jgi:hypothetical protein